MSSDRIMPVWLVKLLSHLGLDEPVFLGSNIWGKVYIITPAIAEKALERNTKNRNKKLATIARYADDLSNGRWQLNHQAIAFDVKGTLSDGQNRLQAIIDSHKSVSMLVVFGVTEASRISIDTGAIRSAFDAAKFADIDTNTLALGTAKNVHNGYVRLAKPISNSHVLELLDKYKDGIKFVWNNLGIFKGVTTSAAVRAAIVRAYYYYGGNEEQRERLVRFCQVLTDGQYNSVKKDRIASQLRDKLSNEKYYGRKRISYGLTEKAIVSFVEEKMLSRLIAPDFEMFPFEEEEREEVLKT